MKLANGRRIILYNEGYSSPFGWGIFRLEAPMNRMVFLGIALWLGSCSSPTPQEQPKPKDAPKVERVIIISVDGCRPDVMLRANCPNIRSLMKNGTFTFWARTTEVSVTLASHTSMLTGVTPERHDIWWNRDIPEDFAYSPNVPTIFELAKARGLSTAMSVGKGKFRALVKQGSLDWDFVPDDYEHNIPVANKAADMIRSHQPQLLFVHLPDSDDMGHKHGWGSKQQVEALEKADEAVGILLSALTEKGILETTAIIFSADHGGQGRGHGADDARSRHIPWILSGPGIKKNEDLTASQPWLTVNTEDTFATACFLLNIPLDEEIDGKPILVALETPEEELLKDAPPRKEPPAQPQTPPQPAYPSQPYLPYQARK
jgi:arylsulfatase A-like enzyme